LLADSREHLLGRTVAEALPATEAAAVMSALREAAAKGVSHGSQIHLQIAQGDAWFELSVAAKEIVPGESQRFVVLSRDITGRKHAEEDLKRLNETLTEEVRNQVAHNMEQERLLIQQSRLAAMGEMVHNIAHQWRQPINALTLLLANIKDSYEFNELTREYLDNEVKTGQRLIQGMSTTIDDFRNFFMPNKEKERFLTWDAIEAAIKLVFDSFAAHNIKIVREKSSEPCVVFGYPNEFAQVVLNILTNAKEAITVKKIAGELGIGIKTDGNTVIVSIRDNGGGIPDEILGKVFDPYFTTKERGSGIGLYMSKMIMSNMGGSIAIRNIGGGAETLLTLPLASNHDESGAAQ
jgi:signal transduction histidine kinase